MHETPYNLGQLWRKVAASDGPALRYESESISFATLDKWSDSLAGLLLEDGARKGDVIGIGHEKTPLAYALMLACLKIGAPYVILDSGSPVERLAKITATAQPCLLFYDDPAYAETFARLGVPSSLLEPAMLKREAPCLDEHVAAVTGASVAYIMFTSGSTGMPKGVAVPHANVIRFVAWGQRRFKVVADDIFAQLSPMYFDNSVFDFYVGLFSGACLAPVQRRLLNSPYDLVKHVAAMKCTVWFSVPSLLIYLMTMKTLKPELLPSLRSISFGGEGYPKPELKKLYDLFGQSSDIVNVYGPTECTCICSSHNITSADFNDCEGLPALGRINPDFDFYIADADESGVGELILLGEQVAAGYFNDAERTAQAFFLNYEPCYYGQRAYRTGDLVREQDGLLYFAGRKDNQIKHMGYRIELEEIEHAMMRLPGISRAAVVYARQNSAFGKIIAFAAYSGGADARALLRGLAEFLPAYMIPSRLVLMDELPKNANGKVDRQALKAMAR